MQDRRVNTPATAIWIACALLGVSLPAAAQYSPAEQTEMVSAHNNVRWNVSPIAMPMLTGQVWSATRASAAQTWANQCMWMHSGTSGVGENLYATTGPSVPRPTPTEAVQNWADEAAFYTYSSHSCSGPTCGHYTQMVWRAATQVGCGIALCGPSSNPFDPPFDVYNWYFVVCQYNAIQTSGSRPYLCDYDGNGSTTDLCTTPFFADGFETTQTLPGNWGGKTP